MLAIVQVDNGIFDLVFEQVPTDAVQAASVAYVGLFTDVESDRVDAWDRRGWFDDSAVGSRLWWLRQQALTDAVRVEVVAEIKSVLEAHGLLDVVVTEKAFAGNVSSVAVEVSALHNGVKTLFEISL